MFILIVNKYTIYKPPNLRLWSTYEQKKREREKKERKETFIEKKWNRCEYCKHKHNGTFDSLAYSRSLVSLVRSLNFRCTIIRKCVVQFKRMGSFVTYTVWLWHVVLWKMSREKRREKEVEKKYAPEIRQQNEGKNESSHLLHLFRSWHPPTTFDTLKMRSHWGKYLEQWKWLNPTHLSRWNMWSIFMRLNALRLCYYGYWKSVQRMHKYEPKQKIVANFSDGTMQAAAAAERRRKSKKKSPSTMF